MSLVLVTTQLNITFLLQGVIPQTETLQVELSDKLQRQHSVPDENVSFPTPLGLEESSLPLLSREEITGIDKLAASNHTKETT